MPYATDKVMGTKEAANLWGLSQSHVKNMCKIEGKIPSARQVGREWIIDREEKNPKKSS